MFENLEQRIVRSFLDLYPPFISINDAEISSGIQRHIYDFIQGVYQLLYKNPGLIFNTLRDDDFFPNRHNKSSYKKPELKRYFSGDIKKIENLMDFLFNLGRNLLLAGDDVLLDNDFKIPGKYSDLMAELGIQENSGKIKSDKNPELFKAWKWLSEKKGMDPVRFARCMSDPSINYLEMTFSGLFSEKSAFKELIDRLGSSGYSSFAMVRDSRKLDIIRNITGRKSKIGDPKHGDHAHIGVSFEYDPEVSDPLCMIIRIQNFRDILDNFQSLDPELQVFIAENTKTCDGCNYCIQTDKTGQRTRIFSEVTVQNKTKRLCPLYPGFSFTFHQFTEEVNKCIFLLLNEMEKYAAC